MKFLGALLLVSSFSAYADLQSEIQSTKETFRAAPGMQIEFTDALNKVGGFCIEGWSERSTKYSEYAAQLPVIAGNSVGILQIVQQGVTRSSLERAITSLEGQEAALSTVLSKARAYLNEIGTHRSSNSECAYPTWYDAVVDYQFNGVYEGPNSVFSGFDRMTVGLNNIVALLKAELNSMNRNADDMAMDRN